MVWQKPCPFLASRCGIDAQPASTFSAARHCSSHQASDAAKQHASTGSTAHSYRPLQAATRPDTKSNFMIMTPPA